MPVGLLAGFLLNLYCWQFLPDVSWLWWNVFGFVATLVTGIAVSRLGETSEGEEGLNWSYGQLLELGYDSTWKARHMVLVVWFLLLMGVLLML